MHKPPTTHAGCDTSQKTVDVVRRSSNGKIAHRTFDNSAAGHKKLIHWLGTGPVRVVLEASGAYSLDLALALHRAESVEVMVANPRALKDYRRSKMEPSKTDKVDATIICDYAYRMEFVPWQVPAPEVFELRQMARRIQTYVDDRTAARNRLHAAKASTTTCRVILNDLEVHLRHLERRISELEKQAGRLIRATPSLWQTYTLLLSIPGIAMRSAIQLMAELLMLPDGLSVRAWVAYAGMDVRDYKSGTCVNRPRRISRVGNARLRRALYMPALVAMQCDPNVSAFRDKLLAKNKKPMVVIVAVMRKLLHAIYGMLKHGTDFEGTKLYAVALQSA